MNRMNKKYSKYRPNKNYSGFNKKNSRNTGFKENRYNENRKQDKKTLKKTFEKIHEIHPEIKKLKFRIEDIRFSTPQEIAKYRASRLKCNTIVDIGC